MKLEPAQVQVGATAWGTRRFDVILEAVSAAPVPVSIDGGSETMVSCTAATGPWARRCQPLGDWSFTQVGGVYRASRSVWVKAAAGSTATTWSVTASTPFGDVNRPTATVDVVEDPGPPPATSIWSGTLTLLGAADSTPTVVPVRMWDLPNAYLFFDDLHFLSRGKILIGRSPEIVAWQRWIGAPTTANNTVGAVWAGAVFEPNSVEVDAAHLDAVLAFGFGDTGATQRWRVDLTRGDPLTVNGCPCGTGFTCDPTVNACLPGDPWDGLNVVTMLEVGLGAPHDVAVQYAPQMAPLGTMDLSSPGIFALSTPLKNFVFSKLGWNNPTKRPAADLMDSAPLCYKSSSTTNDVFGTSQLAVSGDVACTTGAAVEGIDFASLRDRNDTKLTRQVLAACVSELAAPMPPQTGTLTAAQYDARVARKTCINKEVFIHGFTWAYWNAKRRLAARFLQEWLQTHAFVALEGLQERRLADALIDDPGTDSAAQVMLGAIPSYDTLLDTLRSGWRTALDWTAIGMLNSSTIAELRLPDYRPVSTVQHTAQRDGVVVTMVESASATLDLVAAYLAEQQGVAYQECSTTSSRTVANGVLDRAGELYRYTETAVRAAEMFHGRAVAASCFRDDTCGTGSTCVSNVCTNTAVGAAQVSWEARWNQVRAEYESKRAGVAAALGQIAECRNPFGISDDYTPVFFRENVDVTKRFVANSEYMLNEWAKPLVDGLTGTSLTQIRNDWLQLASSQVQQQLDVDLRNQRRRQVSESYGRSLIQACGLTITDATTVLPLFKGPHAQLDEYNCELTAAPACVIDQSARRNLITAAMARYTLCTWNQLAPKLDLRPATWGGKDLAAAAAGFASATVASQKVQSGGVELPVDLLYARPPGLESVPDTMRDAAQSTCSGLTGGKVDLPSVAQSNPALTRNADCHRGTLGESVMALHTSMASMRAARGRLDSARALFKGQIAFCVEKDEFFNHNTELRAAHDAEIAKVEDELHEVNHRLVLIQDMHEHVASPFTLGVDLFNSLFDVIAGNDWDSHNPAELKNQADILQRAIRDENTAFGDLMTERGEQQVVQECFHQAEVIREGITTAALDFQTADSDHETARLRVENLRREIRQTALEGQAAVDRENAVVGPDFAHPFWIKQSVDDFRRDFQRARRITYLAVRAAEYDLQVSLPDKQLVVLANHPLDLVPVIHHLQELEASPVIGDGEPEDGIKVVSLRDDILKLAPAPVTDPSAPRPISADERFRSRLLRDGGRIYDADGHYIGQGIRFHLHEGDLDLGLCAERGWYVSADVTGTGLGSSRIQVFLLKGNTFYSQDCDYPAQSDNYQASTVDMQFNPFLSGPLTVQPKARGRFSPATMNATVNTTGDAFGGPQDAGSSRAFAGRGVYGEYVLFFPYNSQTGTYSVDLGKVSDVRLRFDYLFGVNVNVNAKATPDDAEGL
ncbi:MAG: hypothetical protein K8W52_25690 [Deltaproteobacteria bacterium]|nr:hypothetical protein [Deltaproteobacteria bacterium]